MWPVGGQRVWPTLRKGKPVARRARKATDLSEVAGLPNRGEMRRNTSYLAAAAITLLVGLGAAQDQALSTPGQGGSGADPGGAGFAPGQILVKLKDDVPADSIASVNRRNDASLEEKIPHSRVSVVDLPEDLSVSEAIKSYEDSPEVEYAEPNYVYQLADYPPTPNDPSFPKMYDLENRGQYGGTFDADIDAPEAWDATTGSAVVAVIDTGIDINHRDLKDNIWTNPGEIAGNKIDDDDNGYVDDVHGWDFHDDDNTVYDGARQDTHATHVAGTIAAEGNNDVGVTGVTWQAKIMPLKVVDTDDQFGIHTDDVIAAIRYAVRNGAAISNNSWGGGNYGQILLDEIRAADQAGHLFVAAAGNGGADFVGDDNDSKPFYPASYDSDNIISVAASNNEDKLTSFSNYGATSVDLAAPGKQILSTYPDDTYGYGEGTSMATPHVSGAAALIKSKSPQSSDEAMRSSILGSVDEKPSLTGKVATGGRLNAAKAVGQNTAPVVLDVSPGGKTRDRTPTIGATVSDDETELIGDQIKLYLDDQPKQVVYDQNNDQLIYQSGKLSVGGHTVKVVVTDGQGLQEARTWKFKVVRRG